VSNSTLTDLRAPRLLQGRGLGWYPMQHALRQDQRKNHMLELDTLS